MADLQKERRAHQTLQWVPYSLPSPFYEDLAKVEHYTKLQRQRSDLALDAWDEEHPFVSSPELAAFQELERLGIYSQLHFYSPQEAKDGKYTTRLKEHQPRSPQGSQVPAGRIRKTRKYGPL